MSNKYMNRYIQLKNYGTNVLGLFGERLMELKENKLKAGTYYIDAEGKNVTDIWKNKSEEERKEEMQKVKDVDGEKIALLDEVIIEKLFSMTSPFTTLKNLKDLAEGKTTEEEEGKSDEEKKKEQEERIKKSTDEVMKQTNKDRERLLKTNDEIIKEVDKEMVDDEILCTDNNNRKKCEFEVKLKKYMLVWLYQHMNNLAVSEDKRVLDDDNALQILDKYASYISNNPAKSPFGANIAHSSLKILQKEMNKHFTVYILNKIKNKVMNAIKKGGKKKSSRRSRKTRRKTRRGGRKRMYRVRAVKAWLKRTKRRRKKRKTKKKKKKRRRRTRR